jgi:DNA-binding winged helix-turn-helix (wHTH) protein/TolB-like protein
VIWGWRATARSNLCASGPRDASWELDVSRARFGLFEFDPATGELSREGVPVRLQPQPARVLAVLVRHAGDIVTRDTLKQEVWSDGTFVDFERGLNFCIAQIRSALGDSADSPRFVETLPRRGYRFIAPVRAASSPAAGTPSPGDFTPRPGRWRSLAALAILGLCTAILVAASWRTPAVDHRIRVAVVPFDNETGQDAYDRVARGVADATVARLATPERLTRLSVIGNAAVLHQPRAFRDLQRIGTELGADYVVLAQMKSDAGGVRLIAHLIRTPDQVHVWATTYDRASFTLEAQAEIAESIAAAVTRALQTPSPRAAIR